MSWPSFYLSEQAKVLLMSSEKSTTSVSEFNWIQSKKYLNLQGAATGLQECMILSDKKWFGKKKFDSN